jgi:hypothetical protein
LKVQVIFIVDKRKNILIFLGILDKSIKIEQDDLSEILGKIISQINKIELNTYSQIQISGNNYFYGNYEKIAVAVQHLKDEPPPQFFLKEIKNNFAKKYGNILDEYSNSDISTFNNFTEDVKRILIQFPDTKYEELDEIGKEPIVKPIKRGTYPDGISEYGRDEVLWNEVKLIKEKYPTRFNEGMIFNLDVFLNITSTHNYKIKIDFSNYPLKPNINIDEKLERDLGWDLEDLLYFLSSWDPKVPPHIIEIIDEIESVIKKFSELGKLSDMGVISKNEVPELKPLPTINSLKEEIEE